MKPARTSKAKTTAEQAEDRLVFDRPFELQRYDLTQHAWLDSEHIHANINKAISTGGQSPNASAHASRYIFRIRYHAALDDVRANIQKYRIIYGGQTFELADYDDYNERRRTIKLTASSIRTGTITLISEEVERDAIGQQISFYKETELPCTEYEVSETEQADASQIGLWFTYRLRIFRDEYSGQRRADYNGQRYRIESVRYVGDCVDLYLDDRIGDVP
jgi:head-tail adaptor